MSLIRKVRSIFFGGFYNAEDNHNDEKSEDIIVPNDVYVPKEIVVSVANDVSKVNDRVDSLLFQLSEKTRDLEKFKKDYSNLLEVNRVLKKKLEEAQDKIEKYDMLKFEYEIYKLETDKKVAESLKDFRASTRSLIERHSLERNSDRCIFQKQFQELKLEYERVAERLERNYHEQCQNLELEYEKKFQNELFESARLIENYESKCKNMSAINVILRKDTEELKQSLSTLITERREAYQLLNEKEIEMSRIIDERDDARQHSLQIVESSQMELSKLDRQLKQSDDNFRSELFCPICTEVFRDAVTLECGHTFCNQCISTWENTNNICPVCRKTIECKVKSIVINAVVNKISSSSKS